ncbi:cobyric acid synthase [Halarsenatibacter silvermanii]|uniref:Cobyric acid synthase n=1 Tax=Halarsenatibacter silvermanii TaxID=321763 RepID=A0A1G9R0P7_9FIRM|nr:cobyric acid synthase [Halarsenatibacter silvermanii]SDM16818.1 adenosylcobyric acid synthase (glutamine-hydrolysing) [Halarsenatibacter silvermanii]
MAVNLADNIMVQGTGSSVGKSVLVAGICRLLKREGISAVPFKAQNMALNSFVTADGREMGRAQVFQAEAAGLDPDVRMNPVLLKPSGEKGSQIIVRGKPQENMKAGEYYEYKPQLKSVVNEAYRELAAKHDVVVIEGAGSPAEINLQKNDIVNMGMAEMVNAPVLLAGDIDRGGVFASLYGTVELLPEKHRKLVKALIINKFRGDKSLLEPGLRQLEDMLDIPFMGVLPYIELALDDEDSLSERLSSSVDDSSGLQIKVILLPHISNFTDFNPLEMYDGVSVEYIKNPEEVDSADVLIIPGSKNTLEDRIWLRNRGLDRAIKQHASSEGMLIGICGGFQMLGRKLADPEGAESNLQEIPGLDMLPLETEMNPDKRTVQSSGKWLYEDDGFFAGMKGLELEGYEIHMGETELLYGDHLRPLVPGEECDDEAAGLARADSNIISLLNEDGSILGTYWHGIFENGEWTGKLLENLRRELGYEGVETEGKNYQELKEQEYDKLADMLGENLDLNLLRDIIGLSENIWR